MEYSNFQRGLEGAKCSDLGINTPQLRPSNCEVDSQTEIREIPEALQTLEHDLSFLEVQIEQLIRVLDPITAPIDSKVSENERPKPSCELAGWLHQSAFRVKIASSRINVLLRTIQL